MFFYSNPRVITIIGSRFERTVPATHGPRRSHRRHAHLRRDQQNAAVGLTRSDSSPPRTPPGQTDLRGTEKTDGSHVRPMQLETRRAALRHAKIKETNTTVTTTPTFGLPYPEDNEPIAHLPDILQQQAEGIEKALTRFDFNGTDGSTGTPHASPPLRTSLQATVRCSARSAPSESANRHTTRRKSPSTMPCWSDSTTSSSHQCDSSTTPASSPTTTPHTARSPCRRASAAGSIRNRISITHNLIAPGTDDAGDSR